MASPILHPAMPATQEKALSLQLQGLSAQVSALAEAAVAQAQTAPVGQQPEPQMQQPAGMEHMPSPAATDTGSPTQFGSTPKAPTSPTDPGAVSVSQMAQTALGHALLPQISPTAPLDPDLGQPPAPALSPTSPAETQEANAAQQRGPSGTPPRKSACIELGQTREY